MVMTSSVMLPLGTILPEFRLKDTDGKLVSSAESGGRPLLVVFMCNHCPFVIHVRPLLVELIKEYQAKGVTVFAINANINPEFPEDNPRKMAEYAQKYGYTFPYLIDEDQCVARAFRAACTPDFFLFDRGRKLVYRGQMDDSRPGNGLPLTGADLRAALDAALADAPAPAIQKPSLGCNIKWCPGHEPEYYR